ncbi:MAG TPA: LysM peptidoglycan-binding domain-containing protein [Dissulfurispiraceae bacterium]
MGMLYAVLSFVFCLFLASTGHADVSYTVKKGDSLGKIAKKHHVAVSEIKQANNLKSHKLSAGMKLVIPEGAPVRKRKAGDSSQAQSSEKKAHNGGAAYHVVKKGDTLRIIAKKYSIPVSELKRINNFRKGGRLRVGQRLVVKAPEPKTYTVRKGDSLQKIARKFKIGVDELKEINGLKDSALKPGRTIFLAKKSAEPGGESADLKEERQERKAAAVLTSERLAEVKEMSKSEEILADLSISERLILFAKKMLHLPYRFGGTGAFGLDCSGYVQKAYAFIGLNIPRSAREQFHMGEAVEKKDLITGDLVFFKTYASFPSHVGIYLGNNLFIHASSISKKITIDSLESPYYFKRYIGAKRLIQDEDLEAEETPSAEN